MATEGRRLDTPERQAGLIATLDEQVRMIADEAVRKAYRQAINGRIQAAFGYGPWGYVARSGPGVRARRAGGARGKRWPDRYRRGAGSERYGRAAVRPGPDLGASGLGARQAPSILRRRQEQVLLAVLVNHPTLIAENAEEMAHVELGSPEFCNFYRSLIDLAAHEPELDTEAVNRHLCGQGFSGLLRGLLQSDVYVHGRFARPDASPEEARNGVQDILEGYRGRQAALEAEEAGRHLAETMTEEALARLEARLEVEQRLLRQGESRLNELDAVSEMGSELGPQEQN